jgi:hypothetical protein
MNLSAIFELNPKGFNLRRGLTIIVILFAPLVVLSLIGESKYWLPVSFSALFVGLSDPGGDYGVRLPRMVGVGLIGALLTALGFAIGGGPWGWVVLAVFVVTLAAGLVLRFGLHRFVAALFLNVWFLIALSVPAGTHLDLSISDWWGDVVAWLVGSALWIGFTLILWLARGRTAQAAPIPEIPEGMEQMDLSRQVVLFMLIRALAVSIAVAIAFGLHLPNAVWMPAATLVAMKTSLDQSTLAAEQRVIGTIIGALIAMAFLLGVDNKHALEVVIILLAAFAASIRGVNYTIYCAGVAAVVLVGMDLPHPTNLTAELDRVLFTLAGVAIAVVVMALTDLLSKRTTKAAP